MRILSVARVFRAARVPPGERPAREQRLSSPAAEINRHRDAVAVIAGQNHYVLATRIAPENRRLSCGDKNRPGPGMCDAPGLQRGMQMAPAPFEPAEPFRRFPSAHVEAVQIRRRELSGALIGLSEK